MEQIKLTVGELEDAIKDLPKDMEVIISHWDEVTLDKNEENVKSSGTDLKIENYGTLDTDDGDGNEELVFAIDVYSDYTKISKE